jgi:hypothetical protein
MTEIENTANEAQQPCASPSADTAHFLQICDETIEQTLLLIRDIEAGSLPRGQKRRALFKARAPGSVSFNAPPSAYGD